MQEKNHYNIAIFESSVSVSLLLKHSENKIVFIWEKLTNQTA